MPEQNNSVNQIFAKVSHEVCVDTWTSGILRRGECGILIVITGTDELPQGIYMKVCDGSSNWDNLPYPNNYGPTSLNNLQAGFEALRDIVTDLETRVAGLEGGQ